MSNKQRPASEAWLSRAESFSTSPGPIGLQSALIPPAVTEDAAALTELMHRSTAYSGRYASILTGYAVTPAQIERDLVFVAQVHRTIAGFYSLVIAAEAELDLMFVADSAQSIGLGERLFRHMLVEARRSGQRQVKIVSHKP